jgi:hypothetical protein
MALFVSSCSYYHHVTGITARSSGNNDLALTFNGDPSQSDIQRNSAEIVLFMEDEDLIARLIDAINGAALAPALEIAT